MWILKSLAISGSRHRADFDLRHHWAVSDDTYSTAQAKSPSHLFLYQQYYYNASTIIMDKKSNNLKRKPITYDNWPCETRHNHFWLIFFSGVFRILSVCVSVWLTIVTTRLNHLSQNVESTSLIQGWSDLCIRMLFFPPVSKWELSGFFTITFERLHQLPWHYWNFTY